MSRVVCDGEVLLLCAVVHRAVVDLRDAEWREDAEEFLRGWMPEVDLVGMAKRGEIPGIRTMMARVEGRQSSHDKWHPKG